MNQQSNPAPPVRPILTGMFHLDREGDVLVEDWSDADVIFLSLYFSSTSTQSIYEKAQALKAGAMILTLRLPPEDFEENFELKGSAWMKMSWGRCRVYFLKKKI